MLFQIPKCSKSLKRSCTSYEMLAAQIAADPDLRHRREAVESFTQNVISNGVVNNLAGVTINITVVENVVDGQ